MEKVNTEDLYYSKNIMEIINDLEIVNSLIPKFGVKEDTFVKLKIIKMKIKVLIELNKGKLR